MEGGAPRVTYGSVSAKTGYIREGRESFDSPAVVATRSGSWPGVRGRKGSGQGLR